MNFSHKQTIGENLLYFLVWTAILLVPVMNSEMVESMHVDFGDVLIAWRKIFPYFVLFLLHNSLIAPKLLIRHRYVAYFMTNIVTIILIFSVVDTYERYIVERMMQPGEQELLLPYRKASFTDLALQWNVLLGLFMTGLNASIKFMYQSLRDEQKMEVLKRQNLQAEMDYLKYQINPHFFMNTLNNIHALIDIDAEMAKKSVIELSRMMRYVLYDSEARDISLSKDLEFIDNYIQLMRIRYSDSIDIRFDRPRDVPSSVVIPPLLLIVFVENAFKHGVSYRSRSFIHIDVVVVDDSVRCRIVNSRHAPSKDHKAGIGLENVRKRLELIYDKNFTLHIDDSAQERYSVSLLIPIIHD
ncbi:MAG: histidine kinase [Alistipes sp.]|nr:histidine kinase [Alistipes sp.]